MGNSRGERNLRTRGPLGHQRGLREVGEALMEKPRGTVAGGVEGWAEVKVKATAKGLDFIPM